MFEIGFLVAFATLAFWIGRSVGENRYHRFVEPRMDICRECGESRDHYRHAPRCEEGKRG